VAVTDSARISASDYQQLVERVRERVRTVVPPAATVVVVSRGDEELTRFDARHGWHFPRSMDGRYAGHHPADSTAAISHLEHLRRQGAGYFILPRPSFWWLDYYEDFQKHLESRYRRVASDDDCVVYELVQGASSYADTATGTQDLHHPLRERAMIADLLENLLPSSAPAAILSMPDQPDVTPAGWTSWYVTEAMTADGASFDEAVTELVEQRVRFIVVPRVAFDWISQHPAVTESLQGGHRLVTSQAHVCEVYELSASTEGRAPAGAGRRDGLGVDGDAGRRPEGGFWRKLGLHSLLGRDGG
jgi:hypothetical protein